MFIPLSLKGVYTSYEVGWQPRKPRNRYAQGVCISTLRPIDLCHRTPCAAPSWICIRTARSPWPATACDRLRAWAWARLWRCWRRFGFFPNESWGLGGSGVWGFLLLGIDPELPSLFWEQGNCTSPTAKTPPALVYLVFRVSLCVCVCVFLLCVGGGGKFSRHCLRSWHTQFTLGHVEAASRGSCVPVCGWREIADCGFGFGVCKCDEDGRRTGLASSLRP